MCLRRRAPVWLALAVLSAAGAVAAGSTPPEQGVYTSTVYESEAAMLKGESGPKHRCLWKGREKREGKVICKGALQLKCGPRGWYKTGPC
jgi:hypothetical protein